MVGGFEKTSFALFVKILTLLYKHLDLTMVLWFFFFTLLNLRSCERGNYPLFVMGLGKGGAIETKSSGFFTTFAKMNLAEFFPVKMFSTLSVQAFRNENFLIKIYENSIIFLNLEEKRGTLLIKFKKLSKF